MAFQRENQRISAGEILAAIAAGHRIQLSKCTISSRLDINRLFIKDEDFDTTALDISIEDEKSVITIAEPLSFDSCHFEEDLSFAPPWDKPGQLQVVFDADVTFNSSEFSGQSLFSGAVFNAFAGFDGCKFQAIAAFRGSSYHGRAMFRTVQFSGYGLFDGCVFHNETRFNNPCFSRGGNFTKQASQEAGYYQ